VAQNPQALNQAQELEKQRRSREEKLFAELDNNKKELEVHRSLTEAIKKNGWDIDVLTKNSPTGQPENPQILQMREELAEMRANIQAREQKLDKKEQLQEIKQFLNANKDEFELTASVYSYGEKVQELIDYHYTHEKKILTYREASEAMEKELEKYERNKALTVSNSKKAKEIYKEVMANLKNEPKAKTSTASSKTEKESDTPSEPPKKPVAVDVDILRPRSAKLKFSNSDPKIKESNTTFRHRSPTGGSRSEAIARIVAAHNASSWLTPYHMLPYYAKNKAEVMP